MNIGFFTDGYAPQLNGIATSLEMLADTLQAQGHRVDIFAPQMGAYADRFPHVHRVRSCRAVQDPPLWMATPFSRSVLSASSRMRLDIVHTHVPFAMHSLAYQVARRENVPLVYTYHTLLTECTHTVKILNRYCVPQNVTRSYSRWTCDMCDHIIAPTEKIRNSLILENVHRPISVLPSGILMERFQNQTRGFLRERFNLRPADRLILSVGRLTPEKNVEFLLRVLALANSDTTENVYLALVGDGFLRERLQEQAAASGVHDKLLMCGTFPYAEMPRVYADADVYVTASLSETQGLTVAEALAAGLPLVIANDPALATGVIDGQNGFVLPLHANGFADRILEIFQNPQVHVAMSRASLDMAPLFSVQTQAQRLVELYAQLICERKSRPVWNTRRQSSC